MNDLLIEVTVYLTRYERSMGNACGHIAVVAKVQRVPSAQGKHLVLELLDATPQAHR